MSLPSNTATTEGPYACPKCGNTAGPFDPATGLCEDCLPGGTS